MESIVGRYIIALIIILFSSLVAQIPITVLDLAADRISENEARTLSNRLRDELFNTGSVSIYEKELLEDDDYSSKLWLTALGLNLFGSVNYEREINRLLNGEIGLGISFDGITFSGSITSRIPHFTSARVGCGIGFDDNWFWYSPIINYQFAIINPRILFRLSAYALFDDGDYEMPWVGAGIGYSF